VHKKGWHIRAVRAEFADSPVIQENNPLMNHQGGLPLVVTTY